MVRGKLLYFVLLLLSLSLVAAVNVSTDKTEYSSSEVVTANVSDCVGTSITTFRNPADKVADIKSGEGNWSTSYHASSDPAKGKYTVSVSCSNGLAQENFCVDAPGCLEEAVCEPAFECGKWSGCGLDNLERRTCTDKNKCEASKEETRSCTVCQESWTCLSWSTCVNGIQTRTCYDQNSCGTVLNKPVGQQSCQEFIEQPTTAETKPTVEEESFFSKNKGLIIAVVLAAVLLALGLLYYFKWKRKEASFAEVREWMSSEREQGVSDEGIRSALVKRGWAEKDIKAAFKKLR